MAPTIPPPGPGPLSSAAVDDILLSVLHSRTPSNSSGSSSRDTSSTSTLEPARRRTEISLYTPSIPYGMRTLITPIYQGASGRLVWALGGETMLKTRPALPPLHEGVTLRMLHARTTIPVPRVVAEWVDDSTNTAFLLLKRVAGTPLRTAWARLTVAERARTAAQVASLLAQLRVLTAGTMQSVDGGPVNFPFLFNDDAIVPHGPFASDQEFCDDIERRLPGVDGRTRTRLRAMMPAHRPYTFTHGDVSVDNVMVAADGRVTGILDWEWAGYAPAWWEYVTAGLELGGEDKEWKMLLSAHLEVHRDAEAWFGAFYRVCDSLLES